MLSGIDESRFFRDVPKNRLITTQYFLAEWRTYFK